MPFENSSEQYRPKEAPQLVQYPQLLPSAAEYHTLGFSSLEQRTQANNALIGSGLLTDLQFDLHTQDAPVLLSQGAAEETGTVTDYPSNKVGNQTYKSGLDWEQSDHARSTSEKFRDFLGALVRNGANSEKCTQYIQGELDKVIGIGEGLNIAKEQTKVAVAAGFGALSDGTVANFLSKPNAINDSMFHAVGGVLTAMEKDPSVTTNALKQFGTAIMSASERYSALPNREKGHVIGEAMFGLVNPEGSTEGAEFALRIAKDAATHVNTVVGDAIGQTILAIKNMSPDVAETSKQMLYEYIQSKGLAVSELERDGEIPKGFFDNLERPSESTLPVGKGGDWPVLNLRTSFDVVQQVTAESCPSAVGEMLSEGLLKQTDLIEKVGTIPEKLLDYLGPSWRGGFVVKEQREQALDVFLRGKQSWGAELRDNFYHRVEMGHMVVVDGLDDTGNIMIRDPAHGERYEMTRENFLKHWSDRALFRKAE